MNAKFAPERPSPWMVCRMPVIATLGAVAFFVLFWYIKTIPEPTTSLELLKFIVIGLFCFLSFGTAFLSVLSMLFSYFMTVNAPLADLTLRDLHGMRDDHPFLLLLRRDIWRKWNEVLRRIQEEARVEEQRRLFDRSKRLVDLLAGDKQKPISLFEEPLSRAQRLDLAMTIATLSLEMVRGVFSEPRKTRKIFERLVLGKIKCLLLRLGGRLASDAMQDPLESPRVIPKIVADVASALSEMGVREIRDTHIVFAEGNGVFELRRLLTHLARLTVEGENPSVRDGLLALLDALKEQED